MYKIHSRKLFKDFLRIDEENVEKGKRRNFSRKCFISLISPVVSEKPYRRETNDTGFNLPFQVLSRGVDVVISTRVTLTLW